MARARTDSGVHAAAQAAHFDAPKVHPAHRWAEILNSRLPADILVRASAQVTDDWHAQFSAEWRRYRYTLTLTVAQICFCGLLSALLPGVLDQAGCRRL